MITKEFLIDQLITQRKTQKDLSNEIDISSYIISKWVKLFDLYTHPDFIPLCSGIIRTKFLEKYLTKEKLTELIKQYSANQIADQFNRQFNLHILAGTIISFCKRYDIPTHSWSSASHLKTTRTQKQETLTEKYGKDITNISQVKEIKDKKVQSCLDTYGVTNNFKSKEIMKQAFKTRILKYGAEYLPQTEHFWKNRNDQKGFLRSKPHQQVEKLLQNANISFISEPFHKFTKFNPILMYKYSPRPDILIEDYKLVIEVQGDYWHANPTLHKEDEIFNTVYGPLKAKEIWVKDQIRKEHIESFGYKVIYIWTSDLERADFNIITHLQLISANTVA